MQKKIILHFQSFFKERLSNLSCSLEILLESSVKGPQNAREQVRNIAVQLAPTCKNNDSACFLIFATREIGTHLHSLALLLYENVDRQSGKRTFYLGAGFTSCASLAKSRREFIFSHSNFDSIINR